MKIVIVGAGTVGASICIQLAEEGHDITLVDLDGEAIAETTNQCDVVGLEGNGANIGLLRKAGAEKADLLVAVTSEDELNILCCAAAQKLGTKNTVARVRNPEYSELMSLMQSDMNLSLTINPELAVAKEIYKTLRFPSATKIDSFCRGRVEMAEFVVAQDSPICGISLNDLRSKLKIKFLICAVLREGEAIIPSGYFSIKAGDVICFTVPDEELSKFFKAIGAYKHPVREVLIVGGGRTTYYLEEFLKQGKIKSTVVEKNRELCRALAENYGCTVVCNDMTKQEVLLEEGLESIDAFLALSSEDEENAIVSMYAKSCNANKIITMIKSVSYVELFKSAGLEGIVSPNSSTASQILRFVRSMASTGDSEIESLYKLMDDKVEALEFLIKENIDALTDIPLKELKLEKGILIACIVHDDKVIIPTGNDVIRKGDTVIIVTTTEQIKSIKEILR
ncbi:MAG: Trk system potassium transporter TrkA [Clostridia bacterium]|nr:Trk system potassium transporter TrkA [Clostridia bacterium]